MHHQAGSVMLQGQRAKGSKLGLFFGASRHGCCDVLRTVLDSVLHGVAGCVRLQHGIACGPGRAEAAGCHGRCLGMNRAWLVVLVESAVDSARRSAPLLSSFA